MTEPLPDTDLAVFVADAAPPRRRIPETPTRTRTASTTALTRQRHEGAHAVVFGDPGGGGGRRLGDRGAGGEDELEVHPYAVAFDGKRAWLRAV